MEVKGRTGFREGARLSGDPHGPIGDGGHVICF
jgi:hypothetical protein